MVDTSVILAHGWLTQKEHEFVARTEYILETTSRKKQIEVCGQNHMKISDMRTIL